MLAYRELTYEEVAAFFAPYGCIYVTTLSPGFEEWRTRCGDTFVMLPDHRGMYDEWQCIDTLERVIKPRMN
jgi:hypothetical protein